MISIIPKNDARQALRIRRFFLALGGYGIVFIGTMICYFSGYTRGITFNGILLYNLLFVIVLAGEMSLFYSGINLKFKDPSLTVLQLLVAICWATVTAYYANNAIRGSMTSVYIGMALYGIFRLRMKEFLLVALSAVGLYTLAMLLLHHRNPGAVDGILEFVRIMLMAIALFWISYIANYVSTLRRQVKRLASRDPLTNTYNRREILEIIEREMSFCDRAGIPFTLCMLDLDRFKTINDKYGHPAGDTVLKAFAEEMKKNIRKEDYLGRFGGEEFLVLFVNIDCNDCNPICVDRLLEATRHLSFPDIDGDLRLSVSLGATSYIPSGDSLENLIARADEALYRAKANGRDRAEYNKGIVVN